MTTVFRSWPYGRFIEIQSYLRRKNFHRTKHVSNFLGDNFSNRDNIRAPIKFRRESQPQHLKKWFSIKNSFPQGNNYRPISLLPICTKILEKITFDSIMRFLNEKSSKWFWVWLQSFSLMWMSATFNCSWHLQIIWLQYSFGS